MPDGKKSYKVEGQVYDIPEQEVSGFLKDNPKAQEVQSYVMGKDTFDIPVQEVPSFLKEMPAAKPIGFDKQPQQASPDETKSHPDARWNPPAAPVPQTAQPPAPVSLEAMFPKQKAVTDNTHVVQNRSLENDAAILKFDAGVKEAATSVAKARLKSQGKAATPQALSSEMEQVKADLKSGKLAANRADDGTVSLGRSAGFWDGVTQNVANTLHNLKYAPALIAAHINGDDKGLSDIAEEMGKEKEYISNHPYKALGSLFNASPAASPDLAVHANTTKDEGEQQLSYNTSMGTLGQTVGGAATNLAPLLIPGAGEAEVGTSTLLQQLAANTPRMIAGGAQTYLSSVPERFVANYQENKAGGLTPDAAARKAAGDAEIQGIVPAVAGGAFFSGAFGGGAAGKGFGEALGHALKNSARFSGIMGAQAGVEDVVKQMQGYKANLGEDIGEAMKGGFLQTAAMELLPHALSLPSYAKSQLYNYISSSKERPAIEAQLQGTPDGEKVAADIENFNNVKETIPPDVPMSEATKAAVAGKMLQRATVQQKIKELSAHGNAFADKIADLQKQSENIEADINAMSKSDNPFHHETDDLTGARLTPAKSYEDLSGKEKAGIIVPKEYGKAAVEEQGEGENKTFKPMATIAEKKGGLMIHNPIEVDTEGKTFTDKAKAQEAADKALAQHYYENGMYDGLKPLTIPEAPKTKGEPENITKPIELSTEITKHENNTEPASDQAGIEGAAQSASAGIESTVGGTQPVAPEEKGGTDAVVDQQSEGATEGGITFKTAKGSIYQVHEDGTTTRNKSYHAEHGGDEGLKPRSQKTIYVAPKDVNKLSLIQAQGWADGESPHLSFDEATQRVAVGISGGKRDKTYDAQSVIHYTTEPEVGKTPVEVWKNGKVVHFGNEITEINQQPEGSRGTPVDKPTKEEPINGTGNTITTGGVESVAPAKESAPEEQGHPPNVPGGIEPAGQGDAKNGTPVLDDKGIRDLHTQLGDKAFGEVKPVEYTTQSGKYKVTSEGVIDTKTGKEPSRSTVKKAISEAADKYDFTAGKPSPEEPDVEINSADDHTAYRIDKTTKPSELADIYINEQPVPVSLNTKEQMIADYGIGKVKTSSFDEYNDRNNRNVGIARSYLDNTKGRPLDSIAEEISGHHGIAITPQDIADFMVRFPNGVADALKTSESALASKAKAKFKSLTGFDLNNEMAEKAINQEFKKLSDEQQRIAQQDFATKQQLEEEYWRAYHESNPAAKESTDPQTKQAATPAAPAIPEPDSNAAKAPTPDSREAPAAEPAGEPARKVSVSPATQELLRENKAGKTSAGSLGKASQYLRSKAAQVRDKGILPDFMKADLPEGTQGAGVTAKGLSEAFAKSLELLADAIDAGKEAADAAQEALSHLKAYYQAHGATLDEAKAKAHFEGEAAKLAGDPPEAEDSGTQPTSGIAQRVREQRAEALGADATPPGKGWNKEEALQRGRELDPHVALADFKKDGRINGDMMAAVQAHANRLAAETNKIGDAKGTDSPEYKEAAAKEQKWLDEVKPMQTEWSKAGAAQQGDIPIDATSLTSIKKGREKVTGKPVTELPATIKDLSGKVKDLEAKNARLKEKLTEALDKAKGETKAKEAGKYEKTFQKVADTFRKLKTKPFTFRDEHGNEIPFQTQGFTWNDLVEAGAKAIEATGKIADGVAAILDKVKDTDWYKNLSDKDKTAFEKQLASHYEGAVKDTPEAKNIRRLEKQLDDLRAGKIKDKAGKREYSDREKELQDQIHEEKEKLGLVASKMPKPETEADKEAKAEAKNISRLEKELEDAKNDRLKTKPAHGVLWRSREPSDKEKELQVELQNEKSRIKYENLVKDFVSKQDNHFTPEQSADIWDYARKVYIDNNPNFSVKEMVSGVAMDLGLTPEQVRHAFAATKETKPITEQLYRNQYEKNKAQKTIQNWVKGDQTKTPVSRFFEAVSAPFRDIATFGHGHALLFTHAGMNLFDPQVAKAFFKASASQFKLVYGSEANYQQAVDDLESHPFYPAALKAGLAVDPHTIYDDWQLADNFLKKFKVFGNRGFVVLKAMRFEIFKNEYNKLSAIEKADPQTVKNLAQIANHWTGTAGIPVSASTNAFVFAPNLIVSKFARLTTDPIKALSTLTSMARGKEVSIADRAAAKVILMKTGRILATYVASLIANQALLSLTGSTQKVNLTHPLQSDWLKYKLGDAAEDKTIDLTSGMASTMQFLYSVGKLPFESPKETGNDYYGAHNATDAAKGIVFGYVRKSASPLGSVALDFVTHTDYAGNVLPVYDDKPRGDKEKLSWLQYGGEKIMIPVAEMINVIGEQMKAEGVPHVTAKQIMEGFFIGAVASAGIKIGNSPTLRPSPFNEADKKDKTFKYFLDKGLELPNTSLSAESVTDNKDGTHLSIADYPKEVQDQYQQAHKEALKKILQGRLINGVYVTTLKDKDGKDLQSVELKAPANMKFTKKVAVSQLDTEALTQLLSRAQTEATTRTEKQIKPATDLAGQILQLENKKDKTSAEAAAIPKLKARLHLLVQQKL